MNKINAHKTITRLLDYAQRHAYAGWNKYDALDSSLLEKLSLGNKWLRFAFSQVVMRFPINIRPLLGIKQRKNPKGIALFAQAYLQMLATGLEENKDAVSVEARSLLDWLLKHATPGFKGMCWGYQYPWQDIGFYQPAGFPNRVVTFFCAKALLQGYEVLGDTKYLEGARSALTFMLDEPKVLFESSDMKCLSYVPLDDIKVAVMDVSAYVASLAAHLYHHTGEEELREESRRLINFVVDKQTNYGAWFYTWPADDSHITHDNYHTGAILDSILDYATFTGDTSFDDAYARGLVYYKDALFMPDGAPRFMNTKRYPYDIHGAAHGIITFSRAAAYDSSYAEMATKVLTWTMTHLYNTQAGYFEYQIHALFKKKFTLMRWCNGWMAKALALYVNMHTSRERDDA